jgi:hypothetical protein
MIIKEMQKKYPRMTAWKGWDGQIPNIKAMQYKAESGSLEEELRLQSEFARDQIIQQTGQ